jgi:PAS domain S-box-containing protein
MGNGVKRARQLFLAAEELTLNLWDTEPADPSLSEPRNAALLALLTDTTTCMVYEIPLAGERLASLRGAEHIVGEAPAGPVPISWWSDRIHPDDRACWLALLAQAPGAGPGATLFSYRVRHRDGHDVQVEERSRWHAAPAGGAAGGSRIGVVVEAAARAHAGARERAPGESRPGPGQEPYGQQAAELEAIYATLPVGVSLHDRQHRFLRINDKLAELNGLPVEEHLGRSKRELLPNIEAAVGPYIDQVFETGQPLHDIEVAAETRAASVRHWLCSYAPVKDAAGQVLAVSCVVQDITDRKQAEERVRESEERFRGTFANAAVGIAHVGLDGRWLRFNERLCEITGYSRDELGVRTFQDITHPEDLDDDLDNVNALLEGRADRYMMEKRYIRRDGSAIWVNLTVSLMRSGGVPAYFISVIEDISPRRLAEERLRQSEERFRAVIEQASEAIFIAGVEGAFQEVNPAACALLGYGRAELMGRSVQDIMPAEDAVQVPATHGWLAEEPGRVQIAEWTLVRRDGSQVSTEISSKILPDGRWTAFVRDISERKKAVQALREASRQKDEFMAMLGHELRNPLATIRSASELLALSHAGDATLQRIHASLDRQTTHMAKLIDGLLDVSRIVLGKISLEREVVNLRTILDDVIADRVAQIERRGLELRTVFEDLGLWVEGDRVRLAQVFDNLLANAIKFTRAPGAITIAAGRDGDGDAAVIKVIDTGAGIEPELLPHVFEPFRQAAQSIDRTEGGLGLGLALVKGLVELHGGTVAAHSGGPGKGAELVLRLPTAAAAGTRTHVRPQQAGQVRLLVVDDNQDTADMMRDVLETVGHDVAVAYDGPGALAVAREFCPDVILCDIGLPGGMSGHDVARAIRADQARGNVFLVALTGYGRPEDRREAEAAGFDEHLTKPAGLDTIQAMLGRARKRGRV